MDPGAVKELYYITPIANLASIFTRGLLCHHRATRLAHSQSIADPQVQQIRQTKRVPGGRLLWDYVNLYINVRNPMMYRRRNESICVVVVDECVLNWPDVVVTDRNAASPARFSPSPAGLSIVDEKLTFAHYWTHPGDDVAERDHKARMCAEVLVPDAIPPEFLKSILVPSATGQRLVQTACGITATLKGFPFFL